MMNWYGPGMGGWGYVLMTVNALLFWALVIVGIVVLVRHLGGSRQGSGTPGGTGPEQILAERFARGEIDEAEYRQRIDTLRASRSPSIHR